ncbi:MAG TPA: hypothetical protein VFK14_12710 [Solirubrobacterales bacterium]|nr:hypothetical protein [Solirubrobacterales bacterium]
MKYAAIRRGIAALVLAHGFLLVGASVASAASPEIVSVGIGNVTSSGAVLSGSVNPRGISTTYRFEYLTEAAYEANVEAARDPFAGAVFAPSGGAGPVGSGNSPEPVGQHLVGLQPATAYRYRLRAVHSGEEPVFSVVRPFTTQAATNVFELLDDRGWELVSPLEKGGGAIQPPGQVSGGGVVQAAAGGGSITYSSADSFGPGAQGAPSGSQYLATRGSGGWTTANITTPLLSGSYGSEPDGVPYQVFSGSLGFGLLSNGERCRGEAGGECPVANPPLPGSGAPAGYRDYYRRTASGSFESLLTAADLAHTSLASDEFELRLVAATPDLAHVVLSSCAALTANATEVTASGGCDPEAQNLYEWSGGGLTLINLLPGETTGTPGARMAAPSGAISNAGTRVYFIQGGNVYLRDGNVTKAVAESAEAEFGVAAADGSTAYLVDAGDLDKYSAATGILTPLTSGGGVEGVLGASADGSKVYYAKAGGVFLRSGASVTEVAFSAVAGNWPAATGTARVSADGSHLLFLSEAELTGYPSEGGTEVFLYGPPVGGGAALLTCVSCNPSGELPRGSASIPGAVRNGGEGATQMYKPRSLSADGNRAFFQTSDKLVTQDTNNRPDVYEWEAAGEGTCTRAGGCVQLISSGRDNEPSYFLDADADGSEAFFLAAGSLDPRDPGSYDVYVAREGGGFPLPEEPVPCVADACQVLPEAPEDPTPGTLVPNSGNPPLEVTGAKPKKKKHRHRHRHRGRRRHHPGHGKKHARAKGGRR